MNRDEIKKHNAARENQLIERNKAYFSMADNLQRANYADAAGRVRGLALNRDEAPGDFVTALLGPDVDPADTFMIQMSTLIVHTLKQAGATSQNGSVPVLGFSKACYAAASYFDRLAKQYLTSDDGGEVTDGMIEAWRVDAARLSALVEKMMDAASPG